VERKKIGFIVTHSADKPEIAALPFMMAAVAPVMDVEPVIVLQAEGVRLGVKGFAASIGSDGLPPIEDLIAEQIAAGTKIMVCSPCLAARGLGEDDLREGVFIGGAAKVIEILLDCVNVVTY